MQLKDRLLELSLEGHAMAKEALPISGLSFHNETSSSAPLKRFTCPKLKCTRAPIPLTTELEHSLD